MHLAVNRIKTGQYRSVTPIEYVGPSGVEPLSGLNDTNDAPTPCWYSSEEERSVVSREGGISKLLISALAPVVYWKNTRFSAERDRIVTG